MSEINFPDVTVSVLPADTTVGPQPRKILIVGQMISGTATSGDLQTQIQNDNSWDTLFGERSMVAGMIRAARLENDVTQIDAIGLSDAGAAVAATGSVALTGTATEAGTYTIAIGSEFDYTFKVAVANGDTAATVAAAIDTAVTGNTKIPVTSGAVSGTVTFTAANGGTIGNKIGLSIIGTIAGLTPVLTGMSGGATDPTLTSVLDVVGDERYQDIVWPWAGDTSVIRTFLDARFNVASDVLDGVAFTATHDTFANLTSTYNALNSQSLVVIGDKTTNETFFKGPAVMELSYIKASMVAALHAKRLTPNAAIADIVNVTSGGRDAFGGPALASKPIANTPLNRVSIVKTGRGWTRTEISQLNDAGVTVIGRNRTSNKSILGEVVTTYKNDDAGNPDVSFKYLNYVDTASNAREFFDANLRDDFAQFRLTDGDLVPLRDVANKGYIKGKMVEYYSVLSGPDYVLLRPGENNLSTFKSKTVISIDLAQGLTIINTILPIFVQARTILVPSQISFPIN